MHLRSVERVDESSAEEPGSIPGLVMFWIFPPFFYLQLPSYSCLVYADAPNFAWFNSVRRLVTGSQSDTVFLALYRKFNVQKSDPVALGVHLRPVSRSKSICRRTRVNSSRAIPLFHSFVRWHKQYVVYNALRVRRTFDNESI